MAKAKKIKRTKKKVTKKAVKKSEEEKPEDALADWAKSGESLAKVEFGIIQKHADKLKKQLLQHRAGESIIIDVIKDVFRENPPDFTIPTIPAKDRRAKQDEEIAVLHISDTQIGKITTTYDSAVAEVRLLRLAEKVIRITEIRRGNAKIEELRIYFGGDLVEGEVIFAHQPHMIDRNVLEQACVVAPTIFVKMILILSKHFRKIRTIWVRGNHGRSGLKKGPQHPDTNWDTVTAYNVKHIMLGSDSYPHKEWAGRLEFEIAADTWKYVDYVFDWGNLIAHGDQIRGTLGMPWYGFLKKVLGWAETIDDPWDNLFTGHFHTPAMISINNKRVFANGTTESDNAYAQESLASGGLPCQRLLFFSPTHGPISDNLIYLEQPIPSRQKAIAVAMQVNGN